MSVDELEGGEGGDDASVDVGDVGDMGEVGADDSRCASAATCSDSAMLCRVA